ncbi:MAG TPA: HAMP domain-containing sensor histidine kinase, partial [Spirochaetia bacterium]|nr:HAMP domain-containing sensor histidine kinase [Spirochaetia bacterium]
ARKLAEDRLRLASVAADAANKAKSDLLAGMSHDLRTPLTAIIGYAEILTLEYFGTVNARQKQQLEVILQCSRHLLELINDILDISRIESGKTELDITSVRAGALLQGAVELLAENAVQRKIALRCSISDEVRELDIPADERRVRQVLLNLLSNALKFTPEDGSVEISMSAMDGALEVSVQDSGIGIPRQELERIFDAFYQIKGRSSASMESGSGLGLALARQIVELHGGRIWAESDGIGKGSRLTFTLPLPKGTPKAPVSASLS